ncbi:MAG: type II toxin-antitoxin system VapC family toxin [Caulobacteraceae bacterium]
MSDYLDASVLVPILVRQDASGRAAAFLSSMREAPVVSELAAVEVASALARLVRMKLLGDRSADVLLHEFDSWRALAARGADSQGSDIRLAGVFVRRFDLGLRAPDAIHLAICRRGDHRLVSLDARLATASEALGIQVRHLA